MKMVADLYNLSVMGACSKEGGSKRRDSGVSVDGLGGAKQNLKLSL